MFILTSYIHDEMYGVALDPAGNYLLLGGSGDEYTYSATNSSSTIPSSDTWVSYLVAVDTQVHSNYYEIRIINLLLYICPFFIFSG